MSHTLLTPYRLLITRGRFCTLLSLHFRMWGIWTAGSSCCSLGRDRSIHMAAQLLPTTTKKFSKQLPYKNWGYVIVVPGHGWGSIKVHKAITQPYHLQLTVGHSHSQPPTFFLVYQNIKWDGDVQHMILHNLQINLQRKTYGKVANSHGCLLHFLLAYVSNFARKDNPCLSLICYNLWFVFEWLYCSGFFLLAYSNRYIHHYHT